MLSVSRFYLKHMESFDFGIRALVQQGGSYTVTLPAPWIKKLEDKKGVRIVMEKDFTLRIMPSARVIVGVTFLAAWLSSSAVSLLVVNIL